MKLGRIPSRARNFFAATGAALVLASLPGRALAQGETAAAAPAAGGYVPMAPTPGKGMPVDGGINVQGQFSEIGNVAAGLHDGLVWIMGLITLFVLVLLVFVMIRFNRRANPTPSRTTHNTLIEVVWTVVPVLILVGIALPSLNLLAKQYESPPADAVTIKATGYQWYWGFSYPDNGGFEVVSNMLDEQAATARGEPYQLAVDNRMVVPANTPLRLQTTAADVIHSFAVPSLWFKLDAVPGRLNEKLLIIKEPGVYYGQCSELCGARHGFMPITVEALPREQWEAWVLEQGGTVGKPAAPIEPSGEATAEAAA